jgi:hypothetical protein
VNERIRALMEKAGFNHMGIGLVIGIEEYHQKFAELIVQECMNAVCDPRTIYLESMTESSAMYAARERIRKHFGVER